MKTQTDTTTDVSFTNCPTCDGELEYQDILNVFCLECSDSFAHYVTSMGTDVLCNEEMERVAIAGEADAEAETINE